MSERIQKILARAGIASRRTIEKWITEGRITVNGKVAALGDRVDSNAQIKIDDKPVKRLTSEEETRVLIYHKPAGEICTRHDPESRPTVFEHLPKLHIGRWIAVGRLDINTSGLLLFTNNGELANRLMHPSYEIEREYAARVYGEVNEKILRQLLKGVPLEDGLARFESIQDAGGEGRNHWYHVIVKEGKNRLVRRLWESQGVTVSRLIRIRFGKIQLSKGLRPGKWQMLSEEEILSLES